MLNNSLIERKLTKIPPFHLLVSVLTMIHKRSSGVLSVNKNHKKKHKDECKPIPYVDFGL